MVVIFVEAVVRSVLDVVVVDDVVDDDVDVRVEELAVEEVVVVEVEVGFVVVVVAVQLAMLVDPVVFVLSPIGQGVHVDEFVASIALEYVSRGHGVGAVEFIGQKFPRPHAIAGDEALGQYVPGRQR